MMPFINHLAFSLLMMTAGWVLRGILGGRWRRVRHLTRLGDARHYWIEIDGKNHAFTDDQLAVANARARHLTDPRHCLLGAGAWVLLVSLLVMLLIVTGCSTDGHRVIEAQKPGLATGAGATFTGPTNSAAPSTQKAKRTVVYQKAPAAGRNGSTARFVAPDGQEYEMVPVLHTPAAAPAEAASPGLEAPLPAPVEPTPAWVREEIETTFGQHQDAAGIVKVALAVSSWSGMRWFGIFCVLVCIGGLLWSHGNPDGYPVVFWKVGGCGVFFIIVADNPLWLLLLIFPLGFYAAQKLNLLRIP